MALEFGIGLVDQWCKKAVLSIHSSTVAYDLSHVFYSCCKILEFWIDDFMNVCFVCCWGFFFKILKICWGFFFFWPFLALLNRNSEEWQESGGREGEEDMRQVISDSNIGRPLLAIHHVVACSPQWAKPAPHVWCFSDADKYEPFIDVLGVHLFPVPLCNKKKSFFYIFVISVSYLTPLEVS